MNALANSMLKAGPTRLFAALGVLAVVAALLFTLVFRIGGEEKSLLFAGVDMREAGQITQILEQADIPFELKGDGSSIFVPRSRVLEARMMVSEQGLPSHGSVGYEIFDNADALGQTQFQQNINRLRALEGELSRTIGALDGVAAARVHLVLPERQLFARDAEKPSASIVLKLKREALEPGQVRAIRNLVAAATPGLVTNRVAVIDEAGHLLAAASADDDPNAVGEDTIDARRAAIEDRIRGTVMSLVEGVVGAGNARVQVTADVDFNRVEVQSLRYDPEGRVIVSSSTSEGTEASNEGGAAQGATAGANVPDGAGANGPNSASSNNRNNSTETINYENSSTTTREIREGGAIKRLSVAVAVDGAMAPGEGANAKPTWTPRTAEELQQITTLVKSAIGFTDTDQRHDTVEVVNVKFARADMSDEALAPPGMFDNLDIMRLIEIGAALVAALAFTFFVLGPLVGGLVRGPRVEAATGAVAALAPPVAGALPGPDGAIAIPDAIEPSIDIAQIQGRVRASSVKKVAEVIDKHPEESVQIIRGWLNNAM